MMRGMRNDDISIPTHQAVDRALQVISYLGNRAAGATLQEIPAATGVPKPSLYRTLSVMRDRGFASQLEARGVYLLGPAALEAAFRFHADLDLRRLLQPLMREIRDISGQTVHLATLHGGEVVYIDKLESSIGVRLTSVVGGRNPAHATGVGKALLAAELTNDDAVSAWVAQHGPLATRTANTITTAAALAEDLEGVRRRGFAIDDEESEPGLVCVAATVPLVFGRLIPTVGLSMTGLKERMLDNGLEQLGTSLVTLIRNFEYGAHATDSAQ